MKLFTKLFLTFALLCFAGVVNAAEYVAEWSAVGKYDNGTAVESVALDENIAVYFDKGTNNNAPKYYTNGEAIRCYGSNTFTVLVDVDKDLAITSIALTFGEGDGGEEGSNPITVDNGTYAAGTWTGSEGTVTFTIGGTSGNRRIAGFKVTYEDYVPPVIADGTYYIKNVASGNYLTGANSWGTQASVAPAGTPFEVTFLSGGGYAFKNTLVTVDNKYLGSNLYVDSTTPEGGFAIEKNEDGTYVIKLAGKYLAQGDNKGTTNDNIVVTVDELTDAAKWQILTLDEAVAALKASTNTGATFLISNPNFNRNTSTAAWTVSADCTNKNLSGGADGNRCAESYHSPFTISQVLANAPAGKYQMTAQGFYRQDDGANEAAPMFFANDKEAQVPAKTGTENSMNDASNSFTAGQYTIEPFEFTVFEDGQLTIGIKNNGNTHQWVIWDNFQLTYLTSEIPAEEFAPAYQAALAAAQTALADAAYAAVTGDEKTALEKAIADYSEIAEPTTELYKAAISALNAATSAFTSAKAAYENFNLTAAGWANVAFPYAAAPKAAAAQASVNAQPTSAADANAKTEAILKAYRQYAESSAMLEGTYGAVNVTDSIVNPNAQEDIAEPWAVVKGEGSGGGLDVKNGEPLTDGNGNSAYKYFDGGDWGANAWDVALEQTIDLPAGKYYLTAAGRAAGDVDLTLFAGETTAKFASIGATGGLFGRGWSDASVEFEMAEDGNITIGVHGVTSVVHNWMSFTRFRLYKFGVAQEDAPEVAVPEGMVNLITNGNLAGDDVTSYVAKEAPSADILPARIVEMAGKDCSHGLVVKSADNPSQAWDTQFWISLNQELPIGAKLHVEFDYQANQAAKASTQTHGAPGSYKGGFKGDINFTTEWQKYSVDYEVTSAGIQSIALNLAEEKTATEYRFDNFGVWAEMPKEVTWKDIIVNGDMEGSDAQCFFVTEATVGPKMATFTEGIGKDGSKAIKLQSADSPAQDWDTQFFIRLPYQLPAGTRYKVSFDYKADKEGGFDTQAHAEPGQYIHWAMIGSGNFTTDWQTYSAEGAVPEQCDGSENKNDAGEVLYLKTLQTIAFNLAKNKAATEFIFDNVKFEIDEEIIPTLNKNPYVGPDAPEIAVPEGMINLIANGNLAGEDVSSYVAKEAPSADIVGARIVAGAGKDYSHGLVVKSADNPSQAWDTQFWISLSEELPVGAKLHVEFDYAANKAAKASTQTHAAPGSYKGGFKGDINFTTEWQKYSVDYDVTAAGIQSIALNLAEEKTATEYYFDNFGVWYEAPIPVEEWTDLIVNGNMEGESMECFYVTEQGVGGPFVAVATEGIGKDGSKAVKVQSADDPSQDWDSQFFIRLPYQLPAGTKYKVSFDYKADKEGGFDTQAHAEPGQYIHWAMIGSGNFTTDWQTYENEGVVPEQCDGSENKNDAGEVLYVKTFQTIAFNLAKNKVATMFVFDNVKFEIPADVAKTLTPNPAVNPQPYPVGIQTVKSVKNVEGMYNLNGQKVNKAQKGLYILNGKKMVVK